MLFHLQLNCVLQIRDGVVGEFYSIITIILVYIE